MKIWLLLLCTVAGAQPVELAHITAKPLERTVKLPGELAPYESVELHARVNGYVERVTVDRGSFVKAGDLLIEITAPEVKAQIAEAESRVQVAQSQRAESAARLAAAQSTFERLKSAAQTPGAIAGNELVQAEKTVDAAQASVAAGDESVRAAKAALESIRQMESYLNVRAPFAGVVTERFVHPGALVGPASGAQGALVRIEQNSRLRLVVAVPESDVGGIVRGAHVSFTVPAYPGQTFSGSVARVPHSIDAKTRAMPVELDVPNPGLRLAPGMFPEVQWPVRTKHASLLAPQSAVVTTTERTFVIRDQDGRAEWVSVRKGVTSGEAVEVRSDELHAGDAIVRRASDEIRPGTKLR